MNESRPTEHASREIDFEDMHLIGGKPMQMQLPGPVGPVHHPVHFVGVLPGISLITTLPFQDAKPIWLRPNLPVTFRILLATHVYAFNSTSIRAHSRPGGYGHFTIPALAHCRPVRKHPRIEIRLPVEIARPDNTRSMAILHDLSLRGATIEIAGVLAQTGERIGIDIPILLPETSRRLTLSAEVRSSSDYLASIEQGQFRYGLEFIEVSDDDSLLLHYFIDYLVAELHAKW